MNKSTREGQKELLKLSPEKSLPKEIKKQVSPNHTYVSFNMSDQLETKFAEVKALLGSKAYNLNMSEFIEAIADIAIVKLKENKFGKKRMENLETRAPLCESHEACVRRAPKCNAINTRCGKAPACVSHQSEVRRAPLFVNHEAVVRRAPLCVNHEAWVRRAPLCVNHEAWVRRESICDSNARTNLSDQSTDASKSSKSGTKLSEPAFKNPRYMSSNLRHHIWLRDKGSCTKCHSTQNLQIDHIKPLALGGLTNSENLRLLCFQCNQRSRIKSALFG